jgi:hypothetical protein
MGTSAVEEPHILAGDEAYRAYLISRSQPPIVHHSRAMRLKRLRVLTRRAVRRINAACWIVHQAIVAAKARRIQRELMLHKFPQRPLVLDDKWDF